MNLTRNPLAFFPTDQRVIGKGGKGTFEGVQPGEFFASNTYLRYHQLYETNPSTFIQVVRRPPSQSAHAQSVEFLQLLQLFHLPHPPQLPELILRRIPRRTLRPTPNRILSQPTRPKSSPMRIPISALLAEPSANRRGCSRFRFIP